MRPADAAADLPRARDAVYLVFATSGLILASLIARLPAVRDALGLTPGRLGVVLLALSAGSVTALPLSGPVVHRLGASRTVRTASLLATCAVTVAAVAGSGLLGGLPLLAVALFATGVGIASWDVAMNVEGADVERRLGVAIMPRFHAAFSLGTVLGALGGAAAAAAHVPLALHVAGVALITALATVAATRRFLSVTVAGTAGAGLSDVVDADPEAGVGAAGEPLPTGGSGALAAWREPRTVLIGLFALGLSVAEGSANDWLALGLVDGYGLSHAGGAVGLGLFLTAMTLTRLSGPVLLARLGRVTALRAGALAVLVGLLLYVTAASLTDRGAGAARTNAVPLVLAAVAVLLWGSGAALGFPVAMSAAADDPGRAAARVSVVASIGYVAFLAGPPLLGLLGDHVGVVRALLAVGVPVTLALIVAGAARALPPPAADASLG